MHYFDHSKKSYNLWKRRCQCQNALSLKYGGQIYGGYLRITDLLQKVSSLMFTLPSWLHAHGNDKDIDNVY